MPLVCPKCRTAYEQRLDCPRCGIRLVMLESPMPGRPRWLGGIGAGWQKPYWLNLVIGLLLSQGIYYGLRQMVTAFLLASGNQAPGDWWDHRLGVLVSQALLVLGLLAGGLVAGAGQRWGIVFGAGMGAVNGLLYLGGQLLFNRPISAVEWYGQPLVQAAFGALGGFVGSRIWNPRPVVAAPPSLPAIPMPSARPRPIPVPVDWPRVLVGVGIGVCGTLGSFEILLLAWEASEGKFAPETFLQARFITWEIAMLAVFFGGAWAGANTKSGFRQGWMMGLGTAVLLITIFLASHGRLTPIQTQTLWLFGLSFRNLSEPIENLVQIVVTCLGMGILGGWFGASLLPPVIPYPRGKRLGPMTD